jgi:hypothetical protein
MSRPKKAEGPAADRTPKTATNATNQATSIIRPVSDVDVALAEIRRWETAARLVADAPELTIRAKCKALLEMMAKARRSEFAAFLETALWRGSRHLFEQDVRLPHDTIGAIRHLLRAGKDACPTCRRPLPDHQELDYWRELTHDYRRPA